MVNLKKRYLTCVVPAVLISACNNGSSSNGSSVSQCNPCTLFVTESSYNGNMLGAAIAKGFAGQSIGLNSESTGVFAADYLCNVDESKPIDGHQYKAFVVDGLNRVACVSANCQTNGINENKNWVLYPSKLYVYVNESPIFLTNESAIYPFTSPLQSRSPYKDTKYPVTGFAPTKDWTSPAASSNTCKKWTSSSTATKFEWGEIRGSATASQTSITAVAQAMLQSSTAASCNISNPPNQALICVEQ